jgi:hypothetical protein
MVSQTLRDSAGHHDARCMLNIAGVCQDATTAKTRGCMLCHLRFAGFAGGAQKPPDFCATFGCTDCHRALDGNGTTKGLVRGSADWLFYAFRGAMRTIAWWIDHGYLTARGAE